MPVARFASAEKYRRNLAYRHIHGIPFTATRVVVGGRERKVDHSRDTPSRRRINEAQRRKVAAREQSREQSREQRRKQRWEQRREPSRGGRR